VNAVVLVAHVYEIWVFQDLAGHLLAAECERGSLARGQHGLARQAVARREAAVQRVDHALAICVEHHIAADHWEPVDALADHHVREAERVREYLVNGQLLVTCCVHLTPGKLLEDCERRLSDIAEVELSDLPVDIGRRPGLVPNGDRVPRRITATAVRACRQSVQDRYEECAENLSEPSSSHFGLEPPGAPR